MMRQLWDDILTRFGQEVTLRGEEAVTCRAIIQPCPHRSGGQEVPGPLGLERQERFRYILIDEFQDICPLQYEVVRLLAAPRDNLFIVGDDDQAIYGFRGSRSEEHTSELQSPS